VREDEWHTKRGCGALVHEVNAVPNELVERIELALSSTPVELIGPVGHEALQPFQLCALSPAYAGYLVGPSCMAQPCPQIIEHLIRDVNPKWFHYNTPMVRNAINKSTGFLVAAQIGRSCAVKALSARLGLSGGDLLFT